MTLIFTKNERRLLTPMPVSISFNSSERKTSVARSSKRPVLAGSATLLMLSGIAFAQTICPPPIDARFTEPPAAEFMGPITITQGGTYSGKWRGDSTTSAITIATTEPVIIENSVVSNHGTMINGTVDGIDVTIRNTKAFGQGYVISDRGKFVNLTKPRNVNIHNNYFQRVWGMKINGFTGTETGQTIRVSNNLGVNMSGLAGSKPHFLQLQNVVGLVGGEIAWNKVINEPGNSTVEDVINIYDSSGTESSPIFIHHNYILGAYPSFPSDQSHSGGGIITDGTMKTDPNLVTSWVLAENNTVIDTTNYGMAISNGHNNTFRKNRIFSSGYLLESPDYNFYWPTANNLTTYSPQWLKLVSAQNVGMFVKRYQTTSENFHNNIAQDNVVGWNSARTGKATINNFFFPPDSCPAADCSGNVAEFTTALTPNDEANLLEVELQNWRQAAVAFGQDRNECITLGPNTPIVEAFALGKNGAGRLGMVAYTTDGKWWGTEDKGGDTFVAWGPLGSNIPVVAPGSIPAVGLDQNHGGMEVFVRAQNNKVFHTWQTATGWADWISLYGTNGFSPEISSNVAVSIKDFTAGTGEAVLSVFAVGEGDLQHIEQYRKSDGSINWGNWLKVSNYGNIADQTPGIAWESSISKSLFIRNNLGEVLTATSPNWSKWTSLGKPSTAKITGNINAESDPRNNQLEAFARGDDGAIWNTWKGTDGTWHAWSRFVSPFTVANGGNPVLGLNPWAIYIPDINALHHRDEYHFSIEVFVLGDDGRLYHNWKNKSASWVGWHKFDGLTLPDDAQLIGDPVVNYNTLYEYFQRDTKVHPLEVSVRDTSGRVWYTRQIAPIDGKVGASWGSWRLKESPEN